MAAEEPQVAWARGRRVRRRGNLVLVDLDRLVSDVREQLVEGTLVEAEVLEREVGGEALQDPPEGGQVSGREFA
jgi:hypothetical protein